MRMSLGIVLVTFAVVALGLYLGVALGYLLDALRSPWTVFVRQTPWPWRWVVRLVRWATGHDT